MNNVRVVLLEYGDGPEELYFFPKEGHYLEQKLISYEGIVILKLYDMLEVKGKHWYNGDSMLVELLLTINMDNVKYIRYDE